MDAFQTSRRELLSTALALGATLALRPAKAFFSPSRLPFATPTVSSLHLLQAGKTLSAFQAGVGKALGPHCELRVSSLENLNHLEDCFQNSPGGILLGTLPESHFIEFNELLRGADLICSGSHTACPGFSRHHFQSTPQSLGIGAALAQILKDQQRQGLVKESALQAGSFSGPTKRALPALSFTSWEEGLGYCLATIATGQWRPREALREILVGEASRNSLNYHSFVSFIARI